MSTQCEQDQILDFQHRPFVPANYVLHHLLIFFSRSYIVSGQFFHVSLEPMPRKIGVVLSCSSTPEIAFTFKQLLIARRRLKSLILVGIPMLPQLQTTSRSYNVMELLFQLKTSRIRITIFAKNVNAALTWAQCTFDRKIRYHGACWIAGRSNACCFCLREKVSFIGNKRKLWSIAKCLLLIRSNLK